MSVLEDSIDSAVDEVVEGEVHDFSVLSRKPVTAAQPPATAFGAVTARLHGFGGDDRPLLMDLPGLPGEVVAARTTVPLRLEQRGSTVVVLFEQNDVRRPIVIGVIEEQRGVASTAAAAPVQVSVQADNQRVTLSAEREIVLQCGQASITLTRAGKVIIKGSYIASQSTGYNRIKGAAVDIN